MVTWRGNTWASCEHTGWIWQCDIYHFSFLKFTIRCYQYKTIIKGLTPVGLPTFIIATLNMPSVWAINLVYRWHTIYIQDSSFINDNGLVILPTPSVFFWLNSSSVPRQYNLPGTSRVTRCICGSLLLILIYRSWWGVMCGWRVGGISFINMTSLV